MGERMLCPDCKEVVKVTDNRCPWCQKRLAGLVSDSTAARPDDGHVKDYPAAPAAAFCPRCEAKVRAVDGRCPFCKSTVTSVFPKRSFVNGLVTGDFVTPATSFLFARLIAAALVCLGFMSSAGGIVLAWVAYDRRVLVLAQAATMGASGIVSGVLLFAVAAILVLLLKIEERMPRTP